jgi:hypothetical protein
MRILCMAVGLLSVNLALLLGSLLPGRAVVAQTAPSVLRARAIELVDDRGRVRAQLDVESSGEVVFRLRDGSGTVRVKLGASEEGSGLLLLDETTDPGIHMVAKRGNTSLTVAKGAQRHILTP